MTPPLPRFEVLATGEGRAPRIEERTLAELDDRDLVAAILAGELAGVLLTDAFDPAEMARLVAWLDAHPGPWGPLRAPPFPGESYGAVLLTCPPDLVAYTARAADLAAAWAQAGADLPARFLDGLTRLRGGRPVAAPRSAAGRGYAPITVKRLGPGQGVAIHSEHATWDAMAELVPTLQAPVHQLSAYAPMAVGPTGGELLLYHPPPPARRPRLDGLPDDQAHPLLAAFGLSVVRPRVGDLLLFDGGSFNHRVTPCPTAERWTVGGFLAPGADGVLRLWS